MTRATGRRRGRGRPHRWAAALFAAGFGAGAWGMTVEELQRQLAERDARIDALLRRVEALEQRGGGVPARAEQPAVPPSPSPSPSAGAGAGAAAAVAAPMPPTTARAPAAAPAGPEDAADEPSRALERALVREGGLVLPLRAFEVEPEFRYTYRSFDGLRLATQGGQTFVYQRNERRDTVETGLALRVGLPWSMQADIRVPYVLDRRSSTAAGAALPEERARGFGDIDAALTKQLLPERPRQPGLLATVGYKSASGRAPIAGSLAPGFGYRSVQGGLTAVKRADPMVFYGGLAYARTYAYTDDSRRLDPGDIASVRFGTVLAASPDTSLKLGVDLSRTTSLRLDDAGVAGSSQTIGMLQLGVSTLLSARTLLSVQLGVGITRDAPDFRLTVGLPMRLN